jgi:4-hydroxy-tetrahydrodipicolinate synthase
MDVREISTWTAIVTPFLEDGSVDTASLERLVAEQSAAGNGLVVLGSTGEALACNEDEKLDILKAIMWMDREVPVVIGVGGFQLETQRSWIRKGNALGVDGFMLVTPLYAKPGAAGQVAWFEALMNEAEAPCMLYNIPGRAATPLHLDVVSQLGTHRHAWAIKEAGGTLASYRTYREAAQDQWVLYSGDDPLLPTFAPEGAAGVVSVAANIWPALTHQFTQWVCGASSDELASDGAQSVIQTWGRLTESLFVTSNPVPAKVLLATQGRLSSATTRAPLSTKEEALEGLDVELLERLATELSLSLSQRSGNNSDI